jgi:O-antigen/teichoic acid export membrane protein
MNFEGESDELLAGQSMKMVLQSLASVIGGEAAVRAANFVAVLFIARAYGQTTLGSYALSLAVVTIVIMFADNGLQTAAITQLTSLTAGRNQVIGQLFISKTILLAAAVVILLAVAAWMGPDPLFPAIGFWVTLRTLLQSYSQLQMAIFKSVSKANWIGVIQFIHSLILLLGIGLSFKLSWNVFVLLAWMTFAQLSELLFGAVILYRSDIAFRWPERLRFIAIIKMAAPFGIAYGLANLIIRSDTVILSIFAPLSEIGAFSAANAILLIIYVSSWLFSSILLPEMARLSNDSAGPKTYANRWMRWLMLITVPCALLCSLAAPRAIVLLYGPAFASSATLASVMVLACPLILLNAIYTSLTIATNSRGILLGVYGFGALATVGLDFVLGRTFRSIGVASAIVVREAGMLFGFWLLTSYLPSHRLEFELRSSSGGN